MYLFKEQCHQNRTKNEPVCPSSKEEISAHELIDDAILSKTRATRIRERADREKIQVPQRFNKIPFSQGIKMPNTHKVLATLLNFPCSLLQSSMEHTSTGIVFGANSLRLLTKLVAIMKFSYLKEFVDLKVGQTIDGLPFTTEGYNLLVG